MNKWLFILSVITFWSCRAQEVKTHLDCSPPCNPGVNSFQLYSAGNMVSLNKYGVSPDSFECLVIPVVTLTSYLWRNDVNPIFYLNEPKPDSLIGLFKNITTLRVQCAPPDDSSVNETQKKYIQPAIKIILDNAYNLKKLNRVYFYFYNDSVYANTVIDEISSSQHSFDSVRTLTVSSSVNIDLQDLAPKFPYINYLCINALGTKELHISETSLPSVEATTIITDSLTNVNDVINALPNLKTAWILMSPQNSKTLVINEDLFSIAKRKVYMNKKGPYWEYTLSRK